MHDTGEIEELLSQDRAAALSPHLRARVLSAVTAELERQGPWRPWQTLAATTAAAVLWLHLAWSAALNTRLDTGAAISELPAWEARREALFLTAGMDTPFYQRPIGSPVAVP